MGKRQLARFAWLTAGIVSLGVGALGVVLPLLPTTPFVLLAAFAFAKSAPRLQQWLVQHRIFGPIITDWETHGAIALRYKILACCMMGAALVGSFLAGVPAFVLIIQFVAISAAATFILTRPG